MLIVSGEEALNFIKNELPLKDKNLIEIILFGSYSRGEYTPHSDIDLLLITGNVKSTERIFSKLRSDVLINKGVLISAIYVTPNELEEKLKRGEPLFKTIKKEGKTIWRRKKT